MPKKIAYIWRKKRADKNKNKGWREADRQNGQILKKVSLEIKVEQEKDDGGRGKRKKRKRSVG